MFAAAMKAAQKLSKILQSIFCPEKEDTNSS